MVNNGVDNANIDPIRKDSSRNACARVKIRFANMSRAEVDALVLQFRSNTDLVRQEIGYYDNILILEMTAKANTRFYVQSPDYGQSNEVTLNLEGDTEYEMEARLNQSFSIIVDTNAAGADIYIDGIKKAKTDANKRATVKEVMVGEHTLKVVYKGVASEQKIVVNGDNISFIHNVDVAASEAQFVVFAVEPQSAVVTIDNNHYPLTDGAMRVVLPAGTYNYSVTAAGYHSQSGTFTIAGDKVTKQITLTADAVTVTLTAPEGAEIWVNEEYKGTGSWSGVLSSGTYIFEARKQGYKSRVMTQQIASVRPTQSYTLPAPQPIYGSIMVDGTPLMADVILDGTPVGQTPLKLSDILVGSHTIAVSKSGYDANTQTITITENQTTVVNVALAKQQTTELKGVTPIKINTSRLSPEQLCTKGEKFYKKGDYNSAVQYFYAAAQKEYAVAQNRLADCYDLGKGVAEDAVQAAVWYLKAAKQGNVDAQVQIGYCYLAGRGVEKDKAEAYKWARKAAEQGDAVGQANLAACYKNGIGVEKNPTEAFNWYRKSAEQGYKVGQCGLAHCYRRGIGVAKDATKAVEWYRKSAEQGNAEAQYNLGWHYASGQGVAKDTYEAVNWYRKAAEQGYAASQASLGYCYQHGRGVAKDEVAAVKWYRKAADQGHAGGQNYLGLCYRDGVGCIKNVYEAVKWFRKSAEGGNALGQYNLAECYRLGTGVAQNMDKALDLYRKSAEKGYKKATEKLQELGY